MPRFSQTLLDYARYPSNQGTLDGATHVGRASRNGNPPVVTVYLLAQSGIVTKAKFESAGCGVTTAVGSVLTELILSWSLEQCLKLSADTICEVLGGVPPDKMHCVDVVLSALASALAPAGPPEPSAEPGAAI